MEGEREGGGLRGGPGKGGVKGKELKEMKKVNEANGRSVRTSPQVKAGLHGVAAGYT